MAATGPNPLAIFQAFNAYQQTEVLRAAIELDVFTKIGAGNHAVADIAKAIGASERGTRILCDALTVMMLLKKSGDSYSLTEDSAMFLDRKSRACMADASRFLMNPEMAKGFYSFADAVRKGTTALPGDASVAPDFAAWIDFARGMMPLMVPAAQAIARVVDAASGKPMKVLDIAASHGIFGITIAQQNKNAQIVGLDWPSVLEVSKENAAKFGVADRYSTIAGSAFEVELGTGYDVVLITNFLHHFDEPTCTNFLRKVFAALKPGGTVVTLEFVPDDARVSPPHAVWFAAVMLANTPHGDAYTIGELKRMHEAAGFTDVRLHELDQSPNSIVTARKP
jgi:ubiquinone/menaquinone biosynthesis C-methylase UbiE